MTLKFVAWATGQVVVSSTDIRKAKKGTSFGKNGGYHFRFRHALRYLNGDVGPEFRGELSTADLGIICAERAAEVMEEQ